MTESTTYRLSHALEDLCTDVDLATRRHTRVDWGAVVASVPVFVLTYGLIELDTDDRSALKTQAMPDEWVERAAALPDASARNLRRLLKALEAKGHVTIQEASEFCTIEIDRERAAAEAREKVKTAAAIQANPSRGHQRLANRLAASGYEPDVKEAAASVASFLKDAAVASAGAAAFAAEKAVWMGHGLGLAAGAMKSVRETLAKK